MLFRNRFEAGEKLAEEIEAVGYQNPILLAIPRGGVAVAAAMAERLNWPLDVVITRKITPPFNPELAVGAITPTGRVILDERKLRDFGLGQADLAAEIERQRQEQVRRVLAYRGSASYPPLSGKTLIIVDDGIATGLTVQAAIEGLRPEDPEAIVVAVPVAPRRSIRVLERTADAIHCLHATDYFLAVGQFYLDFHQVSDEEVKELLQRFRPEQGK